MPTEFSGERVENVTAGEPPDGGNDWRRENYSPGLCFGESIVRGSSIFQRLRATPSLCGSTRTPTPHTKKEKLNLSCMHSPVGDSASNACSRGIL